MFFCSRCRKTQPFFTVKCLNCFGFLTLEKIEQKPQILSLDQIELKEIKLFKTPIETLSLPEGSMTVMAGIPGAGKSTFALKIANEILKQNYIQTLYISSEEPPELIKQRAIRVTPKLIHNENFKLLCETILEKIKDAINSFITDQQPYPILIILDSINAVKSGKTLSPPGSPSNIIKTLNMLHNIRIQQTQKPTILIIAHANKQRAIAGPLTLQHMVDIVLFFNIEKDGSRTITTLKNRFSHTDTKITLKF